MNSLSRERSHYTSFVTVLVEVPSFSNRTMFQHSFSYPRSFRYFVLKPIQSLVVLQVG
jgi:hypothetical protein